MIDGARLRQVREARGLTQAALASATNIPQPFISKAESGVKPLALDLISKIADTLEVPVKCLVREPLLLPEGSLGLFRSLKSKVKSTEYTAARRQAEIGAEMIMRLVGERAQLPQLTLRSTRGIDPEEAARHARSMLRLPPEEPIRNLTLALERSGVMMLRLTDVSEHIAGFSAWLQISSEASRPLIVSRRNLGPFRLRFTVAHELGHLMLGHEVFGGPQGDEEREANVFAQALLMPKEAAIEDLSVAPLDMQRLAELKGKWGMSMHAIAMRAKRLEVITEGMYRSIYEGLRIRNWLKVEPGDLSTPVEEPRLILELARAAGLDLSAYDIAERLEIGLRDARSVLGEDPDAVNFSFAR
jgi:Zn-dependent peptidase ImmA (M78 family)/DNA-binding XRE family transcriptional regulator